LHTQCLGEELLETLLVSIPCVAPEYPDQLWLFTMNWKIVTHSNPLSERPFDTLLSE